MTDENEDFDSESVDEAENVSVSFSRGGRRGKRGTGNETDPVQNTDSAIPLFPELDKDSRHVITGLHVIKLTMPNEGFRGTVPPTSTLEAIGRRFGDGRYNVHAINEHGKVLRRLTDIPIALGAGPSEAGAPRQVAAEPNMVLLQFQAQQHEKDSTRVAEFAKESNQQNREMTKNHLDLIKSQTDAQISRDREFFAAQSAQQKDFFSGLLAFMTTSHAQTMERAEAMHQRTIEMTQQAHERAMQASDPTTLLALFRSGLEMGRDLDSSESDNPLVQAIGLGVGGLREVKDMMMLRNSSLPSRIDPRRLPAGKTVPGKSAGGAGKVASNPADRGAPPQSAMPGGSDTGRILAKLMKVRQHVEAEGYEFEKYIDETLALLEKNASEKDTGGNAEESANPDSGPPADGGADDPA
jgi:hypothetical protein